jgi:hypothetical protein
MNCQDIDKLLTAYLEGALTPAEEEQVQSHLNSCPRCRGELEALATTRDQLTRALHMAASRATPPPDSWEQLARRVGIKAEAPSPRRRGMRWLAVSLSIFLLVILVAGLVAGIGGMAQPPPDAPALVSDENGGAFLFWLETPSEYGDGVYAQHIDAGGNFLWEEGWLLTGEHDIYSGVPLAVIDGAGGVIIAWGDEEGIYAQRLDLEGDNVWAGEVLVWAKPAGGWHSLIAMIADGEGGTVLLREDSSAMVYAQRIGLDGSLLWGEGGVLIGEIQYTDQMPMVSDGSGGAVVLWRDYGNEGFNLYAQRIDTDGSLIWGSDGVLVTTRDSEKDRPQLINDGTGSFIVAWTDIATRTGQSKIYAQRLDAEGQPMWGEQGIRVCDNSGWQFDPQITADGTGGCVIVMGWWDIYLTGASGIVAQRLSPEGEPLWGDGVSLYTVDAGSVDSDIGDIYITGDGYGNSLVIWKAGQGRSLYAQKLGADGQRLWTESGKEIYSNAPLRAVGYSSLVSDGSGGLIITSRVSQGSSVSNTDSVYAQKIGSAGKRLWGESGLEVQAKPSSPILLIIAIVIILVTIPILYFVFRCSRAAGILAVITPVLIGITALVAKVLLLYPLGYSYPWAYILRTPTNFLAVAIIPMAGLAVATVGIRKKTTTKWLLVPVLVFSALVAVIVELIIFAVFF